VLTISNENGALWTCGFNPLNASDTLLSVGFMYEPLVYMNPLQDGKTTPMLASSWTWGAGNKSLTFTIRSGVKFSDGTPMTAADVAYTFNLEEVPGPGPDRGLVGAGQRHRDQPQHGHDGLQHRRRAVLLLHRGPDADRARAHLVQDRQPGDRPHQRTPSAPVRT
jgi:ABC-type transport system substrate-binding protein